MSANICEETEEGKECDGLNPCNPYTQRCENEKCVLLPREEEECFDLSGLHICYEGYYCSENNRCKKGDTVCASDSHCPITHYCADKTCTLRGANGCEKDGHGF